MGEHEPIDISRFVTSMELERREPRNRFDPVSSDYNEALDRVMDGLHIPDDLLAETRYKYLQNYYTYVGQTRMGNHDRELFDDSFKKEVYYPVLILEKVLPYLIAYQQNVEVDLEHIPHSVLSAIQTILETTENDTLDPTIQLLTQAMEVLSYTIDQKEGLKFVTMVLECVSKNKAKEPQI